MGGWTAPASGLLIVAHTMVSVGPYALIIRRPADHSAICSGEHGSPPVTRVRRLGRASGGRVPSVPAASWRWVASLCWTNAVSSSPTGWPLPSGRTRAAPLSRVIDRSATETSKLGAISWSTRESGSTARFSACEAARSAKPAWVTTTPLGRPVVPEV